MLNWPVVPLFAVFLSLSACGKAKPPDNKPPVPVSLSPGWKLTSLAKSAIPDEIPKAGMPECWQADYGGVGSAQISLCKYSNKTGAFDAVQGAKTEPQVVKFDEGGYLVLVNWNNTSIADLTTLVRAVQKSLNKK
jgi:hypothetical protein